MKSKTLLAASSLIALSVSFGSQAVAADKAAVLETYKKIAHAGYEDSLITAKALQKAVEALVANPSEETLAAARTAWVESRAPYQQTEVYRFGNAIVDDWEGKVNAWPLDEGLIDYVDGGYYGEESDENALFRANVIANPVFQLGGETINASVISKELLAETLHEVDDVEANVATGYHAIEFLLWGQDTNGNGAGAGDRPYTDFDVNNCTGGSCERRNHYLLTATDLLIDDLQWMTEQWTANGSASKALDEEGENGGLITMLTGMGSLSYGELAGERMKLGLLLNDPEEEHDCFSDNTHYSHFYDAKGIQNVFAGSYTRVDGSVVSGPGLKDLLPKAEASELGGALDDTMSKMQVLVDFAEKKGQSYDQLIGEGNTEGNAAVQAAIDALLVQTKGIERATSALKLDAIEFEGSDSLDNPSAVQ
ncbi:imelysin family protein [Kiloniella sp. b19]|uniref:imelysin family protein n=1 Tax=Kiloniella sp. GXU_MW_B19 TaxID=3141326 RepID=UPI0031D85980